jgi:hypothetical protein
LNSENHFKKTCVMPIVCSPKATFNMSKVSITTVRISNLTSYETHAKSNNPRAFHFFLRKMCVELHIGVSFFSSNLTRNIFRFDKYFAKQK